MSSPRSLECLVHQDSISLCTSGLFGTEKYHPETLSLIFEPRTRKKFLRYQNTSYELHSSPQQTEVKFNIGALSVRILNPKKLKFKCKDLTAFAIWKRCLLSICNQNQFKITTSKTKSSNNTNGMLTSLRPSNAFDSLIGETGSVMTTAPVQMVEMSKWTPLNVHEWLSYIKANYEDSLLNFGVGYIFLKNEIDGKKLTTIINRGKLIELGITDEHLQYKISTEIIRLSAKGGLMTTNKYKLISKVGRNPKATSKWQTLEELESDGITELADIELLKKKHLPLNPELFVVQQPPTTEYGSSTMTSIDNDTPTETDQSVVEESDEEEDLSSTASVSFTKKKKRARSSMNSSFAAIVPPVPPEQVKYRLPIKLVLTDLPGLSNIQEDMVRIFSNVTALLPEDQTGNYWGLFHSCLIIGSWYLDWQDNELVRPKGSNVDMSSDACVFAADIGVMEFRNEKDLDEFHEKVCRIVAMYNCEYTYKPPGITRKEKQANCQDFVRAVLDTLQCTPGYRALENKTIESFLNMMKRYAHQDFVFNCSSAFAKAFDLKQRKIKFSLHQELDNFVIDLNNKCKEKFGKALSVQYPGEYLMLKGFDRAYWLKHFRNGQNLKYKPKMDEGGFASACAFGDPLDTHSLFAPQYKHRRDVQIKQMQQANEDDSSSSDSSDEEK